MWSCDICMQQVADGDIIQSVEKTYGLRTCGPTDTCVFQGISTKQKIRTQLSRLGVADCLYLILCPAMTSSHQQVSLARSPLLKNEDSNCEGLLLTSYDRTLVVKEICSEEVEEMHDILSEYHQVVQILVGLLQTVHTTESVNPELFTPARFLLTFILCGCSSACAVNL